MDREPRCPRCGSLNIVGYRGEFECFTCRYRWRDRKFRSIRILGKRITLPLWVIVVISVIVTFAIAIPTTWFLFAQTTITVKKGNATVSSVVELPIDIGNVTINAGETWSYTVEFQITVEGGTATINGFIIGFDKPVDQLKNMFYYFGPTEVQFGTDPNSLGYWGVRRLIQQGEIYSLWYQVTSEDGWTYYKYDGHITLEPGTWYFKIPLMAQAQHPTEDLTASFKFYLEILT